MISYWEAFFVFSSCRTAFRRFVRPSVRLVAVAVWGSGRGGGCGRGRGGGGGRGRGGGGGGGGWETFVQKWSALDGSPEKTLMWTAEQVDQLARRFEMAGDRTEVALLYINQGL